MYSVVLAAALLAGGEATTWGRGHGCYGGYPGYRTGWGCGGCHGGCSGWSAGCGGCYGGCSGWGAGCHGCHGGASFGFFHSGSSGCSGSYGGCYGCYGGCNGCYGGGVVIAYPTAIPHFSSGGSCTGVTIASPQVRIETVRVAPADGSTPKNEREREEVRRLLQKLREDNRGPAAAPPPFKAPPPRREGESARLTVTLPSDARLWVDQVECPLTSDVRSFDTPVLQPGQVYYYTLSVAVERDGQTLTDRQRVVVTPGEQVRVNFNGIAAAALAR